VRKRLPLLVLSGALVFGGAGCGDKTVTSSPAATQPAPIDATTPSANVGDATRAADAELGEVDQLVRDIEADLSAVDHDAATPEGDPTE
jgi:hypothetical protein